VFALTEIIFDLHVENTLVLFQKVPLWPNPGDVFHYDKFNIGNSSEGSPIPLDITLNHKVSYICILIVYYLCI